jgi:hypothetical protein
MPAKANIGVVVPKKWIFLNKGLRIGAIGLKGAVIIRPINAAQAKAGNGIFGVRSLIMSASIQITINMTIPGIASMTGNP